MALVALGVTGGIGAYKAVEVARGLQQHGHEVVAIMTRAAQNFVGPLTFEAITGRAVVTDQWTPGTNADIEHIQLASSIDLLLIAPATAHTIARLAHGLADDFLTATYLATHAPVLIAPAMNTHMLEHQAVRENVERLAARGVQFIEPGTGFLACGWVGKGRLADSADIVAAAETMLKPRASLTGRRIVVSAGPTFEDLDPVRFVGNRSTGRMGIAIADEAARRGADVALVLGPTARRAEHPRIETVHVRSAAEMHDAVTSRSASAHVVVMAAAVADYTAAKVEPQKVAKAEGDLSIVLVRTRDILAELGRRRGDAALPVLVGFAAETEDVVARAKRKLETKRVDVIVANDVSGSDAGFAADRNEVSIVDRDGVEALPLQSKRAVAAHLLDRIESLLTARQSSRTPAVQDTL
jgi:phosphopantothenoylcysteine decarboxylase / phosphopantothenate---cysteine ligase